MISRCTDVHIFGPKHVTVSIFIVGEPREVSKKNRERKTGYKISAGMT